MFLSFKLDICLIRFLFILFNCLILLIIFGGFIIDVVCWFFLIVLMVLICFFRFVKFVCRYLMFCFKLFILLSFLFIMMRWFVMIDNYGVGICMLLCVGKGVLLLVIGLKLMNGGVFIYIGCCWVLILCIWVDWKVWGVRCVGVDGYVWKCWFSLCNFGDWFECSGGNLVWEFVWICLFLEIDGCIVIDDVEEVGVFVGIEVDREFVVMGLFIVFLFFLFDLMLIFNKK